MKRKMIIMNIKLGLHMKTSQIVLHLGTSYIILKVSRKKPRRNTGAVWTEEKERNARKEWERHERLAM